MTYINKKKLQILKDNKLAIETAFILDKENRKATEEERTILGKYSGYTCVSALFPENFMVLSPYAPEVAFTRDFKRHEMENEKSEDYFNLKSEALKILEETQSIIRKYSDSVSESNEYISYMQLNRYFSFTTPPELVQTMVDVFQENKITINNFLDPSAGMGIYAQEFKKLAGNSHKFVNLESDPLTVKIAKHYLSEFELLFQPFETLDHEKMKFDVTASTIPFDEGAPYDEYLPSTHYSNEPNLHSHFFKKGLASVKNGGIVAYICLSDLMDKPSLYDSRRRLMENSNLISAIRLPQNTFMGYEKYIYNFDLIILQKNIEKKELTDLEKSFVHQKDATDLYLVENDYFKDSKNLIYTDVRTDFGINRIPIKILTHNGGITGISSDVKKILQRDFKLFNKDLYTMTQEDLQKTHKEAPKKKKPRHT